MLRQLEKVEIYLQLKCEEINNKELTEEQKIMIRREHANEKIICGCGVMPSRSNKKKA